MRTFIMALILVLLAPNPQAQAGLFTCARHLIHDAKVKMAGAEIGPDIAKFNSASSSPLTYEDLVGKLAVVEGVAALGNDSPTTKTLQAVYGKILSIELYDKNDKISILQKGRIFAFSATLLASDGTIKTITFDHKFKLEQYFPFSAYPAYVFYMLKFRLATATDEFKRINGKKASIAVLLSDDHYKELQGQHVLIHDARDGVLYREGIVERFDEDYLYLKNAVDLNQVFKISKKEPFELTYF